MGVHQRIRERPIGIEPTGLDPCSPYGLAVVAGRARVGVISLVEAVAARRLQAILANRHIGRIVRIRGAGVWGLVERSVVDAHGPVIFDRVPADVLMAGLIHLAVDDETLV